MHPSRRVDGRSIRSNTPELPKDVRDRFKYLWEQYWKATGKADANNDPDTYIFGYWFSSGLFGDAWSIEQLEKLMRVAPKAGPVSMVMERLAEICNAEPLKSAQIVGHFANVDVDGWGYDPTQEHAKTILDKAVEAGGEALDTAAGVIDRLGRKGYLEFGELLNR